MKRREHAGPSQRQLRVGEELRHALAWILERGEVRDRGLTGISVTVTEVRISPDLRNATVFVARLGGGDTAPVIAALTRACPFLRRRVASEVHLRYVPNFTFVPDETFDEAARIAALLHDSGTIGENAPSEGEDSDGPEESRGS